jgi:glycosyltransferase involved in cell wall biosynthesis
MSKEYKLRIRELEGRIQEHSGFFDVLHLPIGWNTQMFQRYQHISMQCAELGGFSLYGGHHLIDTDLFVYSMKKGKLCVFDAADSWLTKKLLDILKHNVHPKMMRIQSIDLHTNLPLVHTFMEMGFKIVYEYIDLLAPEITGAVPVDILHRHQAMLADERIFVAATSTRLFEDVQRYRSKNIILNTNGVDFRHWQKPVAARPDDLIPLLAADRYIIGYHGALAEWIDYEILHAIAQDGRYELLLIGLEHDLSFRKSNLYKHPRVHFLGSKSYFELNNYAKFYDVAILPFRKNEMTDTVSPVKIFEYMAAGKPIVSTNLLECQKYKSCLIAETPPDFLIKIEKAIECRFDTHYQSTLRSEAIANSWRQKTRELLQFVGVYADVGGRSHPVNDC